MVTTKKAIDTRLHRMKDSGLSARSIAATLNAEGVKTAQGKSWTPSNVSNRLYSPNGKAKKAAYAGKTKKGLFLTVEDILTLNVNRKTKLAFIQKMI